MSDPGHQQGAAGPVRRAVVLLSGGLDSAVTAAWLRREGFAVHALSFDYGQRHSVELQAAARVAKQVGVVEHVVQRIDLRGRGLLHLVDHNRLADEHRDVYAARDGQVEAAEVEKD